MVKAKSRVIRRRKATGLISSCLSIKVYIRLIDSRAAESDIVEVTKGAVRLSYFRFRTGKILPTLLT